MTSYPAHHARPWGFAPFAKALNEVAPIRQGIATTIHALTPSQMTLDDAQRKGNLRRSRTASENIIPTTAAFAQAVGPCFRSFREAFGLRHQDSGHEG